MVAVRVIVCVLWSAAFFSGLALIGLGLLEASFIFGADPGSIADRAAGMGRLGIGTIVVAVCALLAWPLSGKGWPAALVALPVLAAFIPTDMSLVLIALVFAATCVVSVTGAAFVYVFALTRPRDVSATTS